MYFVSLKNDIVVRWLKLRSAFLYGTSVFSAYLCLASRVSELQEGWGVALCVFTGSLARIYICIIHVYLYNIHLQHTWANCFFDAAFQAFCLKSPRVLAINLKNAASALRLAPWLLREGMLFGLLVTRTSFRGVYAARLTPSEVVLVVRGIPAPYTSLFPENRDILN